MNFPNFQILTITDHRTLKLLSTEIRLQCYYDCNYSRPQFIFQFFMDCVFAFFELCFIQDSRCQ